MKMDNGHHEPESFYLSPISQQAPEPDATPPLPEPSFDPEHGPNSKSRDVVPFYFERNLPISTTLDANRREEHARALIDMGIDIRFASARDMATVSLELYVRGLVSWNEYARLAFQPELHPDYDSTIGALLGEQAAPNKPRDFIRLWEERLAYERRYYPENAKRLRATERITLVMRRLAGINTLRA